VNAQPRMIGFDEWDARYAELNKAGLKEPRYGGPLRRHLDDGDLRLPHLRFDNSAASLRLWNFLLTEEQRLHEARASGKKIVGTMKDLGTVPVMAYSLPDIVAFYPDGAWWIPCVMEMCDSALGAASAVGLNESFCPVRAMVGAFVTGDHFPIPDLLTCSVGATCDDFSAIAQRLEGLGYPITWWEIPARRAPEAGETAVTLPGGFTAPASQVAFVRQEMERLRHAIEELAGTSLDDEALSLGIRAANKVRKALEEIRRLAFTAEVCPMPALELQIVEMLAIHFCSDRDESLAVMEDLVGEIHRRVNAGIGVLPKEAVRVFWVNPVADLRVMNLLEQSGGRICGTDYLFAHALDEIPEGIPPMEALARTALADPMVGSADDRARHVCRDIREFGSEALLISRIPGASHCATEGAVIAEVVREEMGIPVVEIEVPPVMDAMLPTLSTRIEALIETAITRRQR
jgi:benzoyl-CoA reductase/2-hydroxyglutaryl-CoA dehydratase subunit BcrC/BadD/HgdB